MATQNCFRPVRINNSFKQYRWDSRYGFAFPAQSTLKCRYTCAVECLLYLQRIPRNKLQTKQRTCVSVVVVQQGYQSWNPLILPRIVASRTFHPDKTVECPATHAAEAPGCRRRPAREGHYLLGHSILLKSLAIRCRCDPNRKDTQVRNQGVEVRVTH